ncbi:MAG: hypothetical protein FWD48_07570 [Oscillospiraceae bacterium]|nr:hypothetical protein [Oscillospiraceae bacterium]
MAKRLLCVILAAFMLFAFVACSEDTPANTPGGNENPSANDPAPSDNPTASTDPDNSGEAAQPREPVVIDNSGYTGEWPDFNDYVPFSYDMNRVVYATDFSNPAEVCQCENPRECGGENKCLDGAAIWRRRWDPGRTINPMVGDARIETTVHEFYGDMVLELSTDTYITGSSSLLVANRASDWNGAILDITDILPNDVTEYEIFLWVKMPPDADPGRVMISAQTNGLDGEEYRQWGDFGMLDEDDDDEIYHASKYWLPAEFYVIAEDGTEPNPGEDAEYNIPREFERDGWVLLRGTSTFVKMFYEQIQIYVETKQGHPNTQAIYIDSITIMTA